MNIPRQFQLCPDLYECLVRIIQRNEDRLNQKLKYQLLKLLYFYLLLQAKFLAEYVGLYMKNHCLNVSVFIDDAISIPINYLDCLSLV